ncbi:hypothetical protein HFA01_04840 [Halobacillus faecis]|uniref:Uncharacterized protein n=1 Tax=Halobacillus faecis TaxID=360184 RepID=A0A511WSI7_9BACI|nr:hypothetical protein HFA01_04840 [Halobacillus faecis]
MVKEEVEKVTEDVIKTTKQVGVEPFSNEDIIELIKKIETVPPGQ